MDFTATTKEIETVRKIVDRIQTIPAIGKRDRMDWTMDLLATHANGNPMDFDKLLGFDDFNFRHDIYGIHRHLDRATGQLRDCFSPRASARVDA